MPTPTAGAGDDYRAQTAALAASRRYKQDMSSTAVRTELSDLADRMGCRRPKLAVIPGHGAAVGWVRGTMTIRLGAALVDAAPEVRRAVLAHELAHVVLGHAHRRTYRDPWIVLPSAGITTVGALLTTAPTAPTWASWLTAPLFIISVLVWSVWLSVMRRRELAADLYATEQLGEVAFGPALAAWYRGHRAPEPGPVTVWGSTHPRFAIRLQACEQQLAMTSRQAV